MAFNAIKEGTSYYVLFEGGGVKRRIKKKSEDWVRLGFDSCKTLEEAREWCKSLTARDRLERREARRQKIQIRLETEGLSKCAWLPPSKVTDFEAKLRTYKLIEKHWSVAKSAILQMGTEPHKWKDVPFRFYDYCEARSWSLDYANTIRRAMNAWGEYFCSQGYSPIKYPTGTDRNRMQRAYEAFRPKRGQRNRRRASGRLSFALLEEHQGKFSEAEVNWLYLSRAFGLRPEELNVSLKDPTKHYVNKKKTVLKVYQPKLERSTPNPLERWKAIPIKTPEQQKALDLLSKDFRMPRAMHGLVDALGRKITAYGGRKDFFPVMAKKFGRDKASQWLGHRSVDTAVRHYDDPISNAPGFDEDDEEAA